MAKKKELPINKIPLNNVLRVKNCKECKGNPPKEPINLPDFEGEKCATCYHPLTWKKKK